MVIIIWTAHAYFFVHTPRIFDATPKTIWNDIVTMIIEFQKVIHFVQTKHKIIYVKQQHKGETSKFH